ncbi:MAG: DUF1643 domain-containing protein [Eubacterium sp.]|nr:DUF1643 domain-containing protein [Eubacterium sp.]
MVTEKFVMQTELTASDDGRHTYEVRRMWSEQGRKGLVLELYPTLSAGRCGELDLSTMHLLNHTKDFGWGGVRIINLYSLVCDSKPKVSRLSYEQDNIAYIEEVFENKDIADYDIVIATGSSLGKHNLTNEIKLDILHMILDKKLEKQVKCIVTGLMDMEKQKGIHPLYLGLHYGRDIWKLESYPVQAEIKRLEDAVKPEAEKTNRKTGQEKDESKDYSVKEENITANADDKNTFAGKRKGGKKKDVLQD